MNAVVTMIPSLLRTLAAIAMDPALGYRGAAITQALGLIALGIERGQEGQAALLDLKAELEAMNPEGLAAIEPTKAQFNALKDRSLAALNVLDPPKPEPEVAGEDPGQG